jgi:FMN phosphatase YigB (HAD superfamily)
MVVEELKAADIYDDFEVVVMSSVERLRKPDPEIFKVSCTRANISPEKCIYIGDAPDRDVEGPRKAGFAAVVIIEGKNYNPDKDTGPMREPDIIVNSLEELYDVFPDKRAGE